MSHTEHHKQSALSKAEQERRAKIKDPYGNVKITDGMLAAVKLPSVIPATCRQDFVRYKACFANTKLSLIPTRNIDNCWDSKSKLDHCISSTAAWSEGQTIQNFLHTDTALAREVAPSLAKGYKSPGALI